MKRSMLGLVAVLAVLTADAAEKTGEWPFAMLRCYGGYAGNERFIARTFAAQERHPGLINEIWFCGYGDDPFCAPAEAGANAAKLCNGARKRCDELGIRFSYQQGITLNHTPDGVRRPNVPDDAWTVDRHGKKHYGVLCCTSPFARDYTREKAKAIMAALRPDSYWPDDDLRLEKIDGELPKLCFCDRCVRLFGEHCGRAYDRAALDADLVGPNAKPEVRREWALFCSRALADYAHVFREAADAVDPSIRLGIQICNGAERYTYQSSRWFMRAMAGAGVGTGARLGGGYYQDRDPRVLFYKLHGAILRDASRLCGYPDVAQVCYEAENWPHIGVSKNPSGMMLECALALCCGCDSLALYWGADQNGEDAASYDYWFDTFAAWKPFLLTVRDKVRGTVQGGVALHQGSDVFALDDWMRYDHYGRDTEKVAQNGLPMTVDEAAPDAYYLDARSVRTLSAADLPRVFSRPVVVTPAVFAVLQQRFPQAKFVQKLALKSLGDEVTWATEIRASGYEVFPSGLKSEGVSHLLHPKSADVVPLSRMTADKSAAGACLVPTEFGGTVAVVQDFDCVKHEGGWPGCRRHATLDALDRIVPGKMPARLLTDGYAAWVVVRKDRNGRTAAVCVVNLGTGETPPLELAIRRGVSADWKLHLPKASAVAAEKVRESADETVIRLPALPAFGLAFVAP